MIMKKTKLALAISATTLFATSALATNGTNMIGLGAQSAATGGTGVAAFYGAENVVVNPGMIGKAQGSEFTFAGTLFMPDVKTDSTALGADSATSKADTFMVPSVSVATRLDDNLVFGIGMYGTSGMGVDYRGTGNEVMPGSGTKGQARSNLQTMRFVPTLAYNQDNFGIGFSPILQYGSLDISFQQDSADNDTKFSNGVSDDLGFGFSLGGYFDITPELTVAASYTSQIDMTYKHQDPMAWMATGVAGDMKLSTPQEIKLGVAYNMGSMTYTVDYKNLAWSDAKGFKDFNWKDQDVISLGAKYTGKNFWAGVGYNHADSPIKDKALQTDLTNPNPNPLGLMNNILFPAATEDHVTFGGGYNLTENMALEGAVVLALENKTKTKDVSGMPMTNETKHSQTSVTVGLRFNF